MSYDVDLGPLDKFLYRYLIIPQTRQGLLELEKQYAWMASDPTGAAAGSTRSIP